MGGGLEGSLMEQQLPVSDNQAAAAIARIGARRRNRRLAVCLLAILGSACGYVLSLGPLLMIVGNRSLPPAVDVVIKIFYAPLAWAIMRFPIVETFYKRYFELIGVDL